MVREPSLPEMTFVDATCLGVWKQASALLLHSLPPRRLVLVHKELSTGMEIWRLGGTESMLTDCEMKS